MRVRLHMTSGNAIYAAEYSPTGNGQTWDGIDPDEIIAVMAPERAGQSIVVRDLITDLPHILHVDLIESIAVMPDDEQVVADRLTEQRVAERMNQQIPALVRAAQPQTPGPGPTEPGPAPS